MGNFSDEELNQAVESALAESGLPSVFKPDPSTLGFPPMLVMELALRTDTVENLFTEYGLTVDDYERLKVDPVFINAVRVATEQLQDEGMSFKVKAKLQAEELLKTSWALIMDPRTPPSVKADLIKSTVRWAGHEQKATEGMNVGTALQINIDLGAR